MELEESCRPNTNRQILKVKKWARIPKEMPCLHRYRTVNTSQRITQFALRTAKAKRDIQAPRDKNPKQNGTQKDQAQE